MCRRKLRPYFHQKPLLDYLAGRFTYQSRDIWQVRLEAGDVTCNGRSATPQQIVRQGDVIACDLPEPPLPDVNLDYQIVYEDEWLLAVNKPGNLKVHGHGRFIQANLIYQLRHSHTPPYPEATLINRLDKDTSGIVLLARDAGHLARRANPVCRAHRRKNVSGGRPRHSRMANPRGRSAHWPFAQRRECLSVWGHGRW